MSQACPVYIGNSDAYGLGIRLGIYLQWTTSVINKWIFTDRGHLRDVLNENVIFIFSVFIATIVLAATGEPKPHAVDIIILEHIFFGSIYTVFFDGHIIENLEQISSFWGILFKWAMPVGMSSLSVWFWTRGLYELEPTCGGTTGFLFAPVDAFGNARNAFMVLACLNLLIWTSALSGAINDRLLHVATVMNTTQQDRAERHVSDDHKKNELLTRIWEEICMPMKEATINGTLGFNQFRDNVRQLLLATPVHPTDGRLFAASAVMFALYRTIFADMNRRTVGNRALSRYFEGLEKAFEILENVRLPIVRLPSPKQQEAILQFQRDLLVGETDSKSSRWGKHFGKMPGRRILARIISVLVPVPPSARDPAKPTKHRWSKIYAKYASKALNTCVLIYSILAIELLNSISGVYDLGSTGQTIPFVIGLATLWRTIVAIFEKYSFPEKDVAVAEVLVQHAVASAAVQDGEEMQDLETGPGSGDTGHQRPNSPVASIY